jgi:hypothetical protein
MTGTAAFAECEGIIVNADGFGIVTGTQFTVNDINYLCCCAVSDRAAIDYKCIHYLSSAGSFLMSFTNRN